MRVGLYLQNQCQKEDGLQSEFERIMQTATKTKLDLLVFPEHAWCPGVEKIEELSFYTDSEEKQKSIVDDIVGTIAKKAHCPVVFNHVTKDDLILSIFVDGEFCQCYFKHVATHNSPFDFADYDEKILNDKFYQAIDTKAGKIGMTICHDSTDPLLSRIWGIQNVDLIVNSTGGHVDYKKWTYYQKTRAIENNCFTVCTMSQNNDEAKNKSYAIGFDPWGRAVQFENSEGKIRKGKMFPEKSGEIYIADLDFTIRNTLPLKGERDEYLYQEQNPNLKNDVFLLPESINEEFTRCTPIEDGVYAKKNGNLNVIYILIEGRLIYRPEWIQSKLYSPYLKAIPNKRYILINSWSHLDQGEFECVLSTVIRTRAAENFCACLLISDLITQCIQVGLAKNTQLVALTDQGFGIDLSRTTGPEALWQNKGIPRMRASWRMNYEKLVRYFFINKNGATALIAYGFDNTKFQIEEVRVENRDQEFSNDKSLLIAAATTGNLEVVHELLRTGADVNHRMENGNTALIGATLKGHVDIVSELLRGGASPNDKNTDNLSALMAATVEGNMEILCELFQRGADANLSSSNELSVLMTAALVGREEVVSKLQSEGADVNWKNSDGNTALICAVLKGQVNIVRDLLRNGAGINFQNNDGLSALMVAVNEGNVEIVHELLTGGADVKVKNSDGNTALIIAANKGDIDVVHELLNGGATDDSFNSDGFSALMTAAISGNVEVVRAFLSRGIDVESRNAEGNTALICSAISGHAGVVRELLDRGADANIRNLEGNTALICAVINKDISVASELLKSGANPSLANNDGIFALMFAVDKNDAMIVRLLINAGADVNIKSRDGFSPLLYATLKAKTKVVRELLKGGADTNAKDNGGMTALMEAAARGNLELVRDLLENGADITAKSCNKNGGLTALIYAAAFGHINIVRELLDRGAVIDEKGNNLDTALMSAANYGHFEVVRELLDRGANINLKINKTNETALHCSATAQTHDKFYKVLMKDKPSPEHAEVVRILLRAGINVNAQRDDGVTALMVAAFRGQNLIVNVLINNGANYNIRDNEGNTALIYAASNGNKDVVVELLNAGADRNIKNRSGKTAMMKAADNGHKDIVSLFKKM